MTTEDETPEAHLSYRETLAASQERSSSESFVEASRVAAHSVAPSVTEQGFDETYELGQQLGAGGMGAVYRAQDVALHRTVAVKVMHDEVAARATMVRRFYKEAQIAAQLEHPGIVPTYNIQLGAGGQPRLAMRLIRGQDLDSYIEKERQGLGTASDALDGLTERLELFVRACDAVQFAHDKGVVHRDLKPENIMVGPHRDAYVMDWGLATLQSNEAHPASPREEENDIVEVNDDPRATRFGELMGTVAYMAPEQALGDHSQVGPLADQFALALTLQELVTLLPARSPPNMTAAITQAVIGERNELPQWTPPGLAAIILKGSASEQELRYPSTAEFCDDVRRFMQDEELEAAPDPWQKKVWRRLSVHKSFVLAGLLVLVVAVAALSVIQISETLLSERRQAKYAARVADQVGLVIARAESINTRARGVEVELAHLAGATKYVLTGQSAPAGRLLRPQDLLGAKAPTDAKEHPRYKQVISFERAVLAEAPTATQAASQDERRLALIEGELKGAYERGGFAAGAQRNGRSAPLHWTYVATPSGLLLNYPGAAGLTKEYDPRTRPWYRNTLGTHGAVWGELYGDASGSGTLLPCNRAVYSDEGKLLAIAGIDFHLQEVRRALPLLGLRGYQRAWLIDKRGRIVAYPLGEEETDEKDFNVRTLATFESPELLEAMKRRPSAGQLVIGTSRYIYAALSAVGWSYVVSVQP